VERGKVDLSAGSTGFLLVGDFGGTVSVRGVGTDDLPVDGRGVFETVTIVLGAFP